VGLNNIVEKAVVEEAAVDEPEPMDVEEDGPFDEWTFRELKAECNG